MAAERRLRDDLWCAAPITGGKDGLDKAREREAACGSNPKGGMNSNDSATKENRGVQENSQGSALTATGSGRILGGVVSSSNIRAEGASSGATVLGEQSRNDMRGRVESDGEGSQSNPIHISDDHRTSSQWDDLSWECHVCTLLNKIVSDPSFSKSGVYWSWNNNSASFENELSEEASNKDNAKRLWELSEKIVGL